MPLHEYREGSVGVPFPDMLATVCRVGTDEELGADEEGEICLAGPAVMLGYLDDPEATSESLRMHEDGRVWLHTGDIGRRDADGFFYFTSRLKRMIKSSGFNVYPAQVETVLVEHPAVAEACVVGIPDDAQGERVKAFVVLKDDASADARRAHRVLPRASDQVVLPARGGVPKRAAEDPSREDRLHGARPRNGGGRRVRRPVSTLGCEEAVEVAVAV